MRRTNKKGFTIVELVIVIAVIAILAAVLIPTFSSLVKKANESADIQAVRQMNTALASEFAVEAPTDLEAVIKALANNGFNAEDTLVPISTGYSFVWHTGEKEIVLIDENKNVVFPEGATYNEEKAQDLRSGKKLVPVTAGNTEDIVQAIQNGKKNITLSEDIDLKGQKLVVNSDLTIDGNGKKISIGSPDTDIDPSAQKADRVVDVVGTSNDITITLKNLTIEESEERAISFYNNSGKITLIIDNCNITADHYPVNVANNNSNIEVVVKDSTITGYCAIQTWSANSKITFDNCTLIGNNKWDGEGNDFSTVVINSTATNSSLVFNNCTIEANKTGTAEQTFFSIRATGTKIECHGCTFKRNDSEVAGNDVKSADKGYIYKETDDYTLTID